MLEGLLWHPALDLDECGVGLVAAAIFDDEAVQVIVDLIAGFFEKLLVKRV